eukprot:COSAG06_NODE_4388_length_4310_cov_1.848255_2_plen_162_part_00
MTLAKLASVTKRTTSRWSRSRGGRSRGRGRSPYLKLRSAHATTSSICSRSSTATESSSCREMARHEACCICSRLRAHGRLPLAHLSWLGPTSRQRSIWSSCKLVLALLYVTHITVRRWGLIRWFLLWCLLSTVLYVKIFGWGQEDARLTIALALASSHDMV